MDEGGGRVLGAAEGGGDGPKQQQLVESFCGITSASPEEALFFLESHNWQLDAAIHSFYDNDDHELPAAAEAPVGHLPPPPLRRQQRREEAEEDEGDDDDEDYVPESLGRRVPSPPVVVARDSKKKKAKSSTGSSRPTGGIRTLADLNRQPSGSESDSDDDGPQEYYTGGEKSGMLVQDPSKGKNNIDDLFEQARQRGATQGPFENPRPSGPRSFTGTGRLLSGDTVPAAPQPQQPENIVHNITFWTNGFTIDDGPLRSFDDPDNASFLESIKKSECPRELAPENKRSTVHVNLIRREEKCPEPVKPRVPFKGVGRTLSSGSTARVESSGSSADTAIPSEPSSSIGLSVDETLPSTSIQLRLADGTRMVARFNNHHTVGDIRSFIDASRPGATRTYQLQTVGFPPKQLTDVTQTIEQAGLASSVVIQRL